MNINRHTYEEYFLLYIDNELTVQQRNAVELFVQQNPDLQQELLWLKESMLTADKIIFTDKQSLLKNDVIHADLQEKLLLLIDGELDTKAIDNIAKLLESDAVLQNEFELLKQTKLTADDSIVFAYKNLLYKNEDLKVVVMRRWKIAVAAMLIGAGLWGSVTYFQNKASSFTTITANNTPVKKAGNTGKKTDAIVEITNKKNDETNTVFNAIKQKGNGINDDNKIIADKLIKTKQLNNSLQVSIEKRPVVTQTIMPSNNLPTQYVKSFNNDQRNKNDAANVASAKQEVQSAIDNASHIADGNAIASNVSFTENNKANNNIVYGFDDDEEPLKKNKVGGFLKKLNRVLQRNTKLKTNSDKSIQIANLSFAIQ